ncbi:MAG: AAA family ATPase [Burkholderiaceae bacterium]
MKLPDNLPSEGWAICRRIAGELDKSPRSPKTGYRIGVDNPHQWGTLEAAFAAAKHGDTLSLRLNARAEPLCVIDLDGHRDTQTGELSTLATELVARCNTFTEVSQSGRGLHIIGLGKPPAEILSGQTDGLKLELYDGTTARHIAFTGQHLAGTPEVLNEFPPEVLPDVVSRFRKAPTKATTTDTELPDFDGIDGEATLARVAADLAPDMVNELRGLEPLTGDGSRRVAHMAICLRKAGASQAGCMAVLTQCPGSFDMALSHRGQDADRATEYLWKHHVLSAWAEPSAAHVPVEFEPVEDTDAPDTGKPLELAPITLEELNAAKLSPRALVPGLLYADLRVRIAAGGVGKTTLALFEAVTVALGRPLWGFATPTALRTVIVTREDSRGILVARLREVAREMRLQPAEVAQVLAHVNILDLSAANFRLSKVERDVVTPDRANIGRLVATLSPFRPDWVIFDPAVSFGVGEARVNDAEQGLIEALRIVREALDCCCELIHHSGKANARAATADQYSGRGGSAMPDGARMVAVLNPLTPEDWVKAVGSPLAQGETGLAMSLPKMSYAPAIAEPVYIRRRGWHFARAAATAQTPEQAVQNDAGRVADFLRAELAQGRKYSATSLDTCAKQIGLTRAELRAALTRLKASGGVAVVGGQGKEDSFLRPAEVAATSAEFTGRSSEDLGVEDAPN